MAAAVLSGDSRFIPHFCRLVTVPQNKLPQGKYKLSALTTKTIEYFVPTSPIILYTTYSNSGFGFDLILYLIEHSRATATEVVEREKRLASSRSESNSKFLVKFDRRID